MNTLVDEINSLQAQVDALGQIVPPGGGPVISALQPADKVTVGDELDVIGLNFSVPAVLNVVTLDGQHVNVLSGSSATLLKLVVPSLSGLPKAAQLSITTANGTATHTIVVNPPVVVPVGKPTISNVSGKVGPITPGGQYTYSFLIDANAVTTTESYLVAATWQNTLPASIPSATWNGPTQLIGVQGGVVTVPPATPVTVGAQVTFPAGAQSGDLKITVTSVHNDPVASAVPLTVNVTTGTPQESNPAIKNLALGEPPHGQKVFRLNPQDGAIEVQFPAPGKSTTVQIPIQFDITDPGTYHCVPTFLPANSPFWTVGLVAGGDGPQVPGSTIGVHLAMTLLPLPAANKPGDEAGTVNFVVKRTDNDATGPYSNYFQFPIRGFAS
jgi:hypothetical protein